MHQAAARPDITRLFANGIHGGTLLTVTWLSFACIFLLPRQFHVTFVENVSEGELKKAFWLFPLYLIVINIFVVPVAIAGVLQYSGTDIPPDMYLLAMPLYDGNHIFTFLAFLGGLSAATAWWSWRPSRFRSWSATTSCCRSFSSIVRPAPKAART